MPDSPSGPSPVTAAPAPLEWRDEGVLRVLDQTRLPTEINFLDCRSREDVFQAIRCLAVRGAPAIGIAGAYGICLDIGSQDFPDMPALRKRLQDTAAYLKSARPTAVNLAWAILRLEHRAQALDGSASPGEAGQALLDEARAIHAEDKTMCLAIGKAGQNLIPEGGTVLTHCNTGYLATGGQGTALSVIFEAWKAGRRFQVLVDETRPLLQGARLTAWELQMAGIPAALITDGAAAHFMQRGEVQCVITGADRIALNGDTANKIGTLGLALLAGHFGIPFYIAAPSSTFDSKASSGKDILIEERPAHEITHVLGTVVAPPGFPVKNPAFDITPGSCIRGFITEKGLIHPPFDKNPTFGIS